METPIATATPKPRDVAIVSSIVPHHAGETTIFRTDRRGTIFSSAPAPKATGNYSHAFEEKPKETAKTRLLGAARAVTALAKLEKKKGRRPLSKNPSFLETFGEEDEDNYDLENEEDDDFDGYEPPKWQSQTRRQTRKGSIIEMGSTINNGQRRKSSSNSTTLNSKRTSFNIDGEIHETGRISEEVNRLLDRIDKRNPSILGTDPPSRQHSFQPDGRSSATSRKSKIQFSDSILEEDQQHGSLGFLAPPSRPRSGSPRFREGQQHRNGSGISTTSPEGSRLESPSTPPLPQRRGLLYHGDGINKNVPIEFNLSKMLPSTLLNELQFARYEKMINMILKRGGKLPGKHIKSALKGSRDAIGGAMTTVGGVGGTSGGASNSMAAIPTTDDNKAPRKPTDQTATTTAPTTTKRSTPRKRGLSHKKKEFPIPSESTGISRGLYREGDARLGWKTIHLESWQQSREWATLTTIAEKRKQVMAELTGKHSSGTAASQASKRKSSVYAIGITVDGHPVVVDRGLSIDYQAILNRNPSSAGSHTMENGAYLQSTDNHLKDLGMYCSLNKFVSRPQLGKSKKLPGEVDHHITRAPPMGSNGPNADKVYEMSDFVIIRKVTSNHYSTIRQATLASIPAVRRRPYAMKTIIKKKLKTRALIETVRRERDIHQKLTNRFILQVLATFQTTKRLYVLLEWCPTTLDAVMGFQRVIKEDSCRGIIAELAVALEYLHNKCIIHRGLEPTNIMMDGFGHMKISDFSTAVMITDSDKQTGDIKCLRHTRYSAPELILGERHGRTVDWFSLGTILYEMLTGNIPFGQGNVLDTLAAVKIFLLSKNRRLI
ncbi:UNVERIFIED_CONTAM: hypothetical protein HDU68_000138 [Siphonaria sp. JEL0065]|nr:hypothetical protein HDU68_000138 [Siphonaria sp. JEL0065]